MKGFGDDLGFEFGGASELEGVVSGSLTVVSYSSIDGSSVGAVQRRRGRWVLRDREVRQDAEAPGSISVIYHSSISGKAVAGISVEGKAKGSVGVIQSSYFSGKTKAQKLSVVSGRAIGDAKAPGASTDLSVSMSSEEGALSLTWSWKTEPVVNPVDVDNDLLLAA